MIQTMTQHSQMHRANMLEWLRYCEEQGEPFPAHETIAERFQYASVEAARTLLADLADRGEINIDRTGAISIAAVKPTRTLRSSPRPEPSIVRPSKRRKTLSADEAAERVMDIFRRPKAKPEAELVSPPPPAPVVSAEPVAPPPPPEPIVEPVAPEPIAVAPAPAPVAPAPVTQPARKHKGPPRMLGNPVMIRLHPGTSDRLKALAAAQGVSQSAKALEMIEAAMSAVPLPAKPTVPVAVLLASIEAGKGLHEFVGELIAIGLDVWRDVRAEEVA